MSSFRLSRLVLFLVTLGFASACHESNNNGPTGPNAAGTAMLSGTVISGTSTLGKHPLGVEIGLGGVTVTVPATGRTTQTDASGNFTLTVPMGAVQLAFDRADLHARATVNVTGPTAIVTISITGTTAVPVNGSHAGEEIEGLVQAVGASSLTILDQRLGAVVVQADGATLVRRGETTVPLSQIQVGMRVHAKALLQAGNTYLATEILLQDTNVGGNREVSGTVQSVDSTAKSFVVQNGSVLITVRTDLSTMFKKHGGTAVFADLSAGKIVDVNGVLQPDGSVLARKVTIEG